MKHSFYAILFAFFISIFQFSALRQANAAYWETWINGGYVTGGDGCALAIAQGGSLPGGGAWTPVRCRFSPSLKNSSGFD